MKKLHSLLLIAPLLAIACSHSAKISTPAPTAAPTAQSESILDESILNSGTEIALGESVATAFSMKYKLLPVSQEFQEYADKIANKISENSNRPSVHYEVTLLDTKDFVALDAAGGRILLSKGFLDVVQTESEFANLLANQIAHVAKQHLVTILIHNVQYAKLLDEGTITNRLSKQARFELLDQGYDYDYINEADRLAPTYAMHVGYDVHGLLTLLQRVQSIMEKKHSYGLGEWDSDRMAHRVSMNQVFAKSLEKIDKTGFPKSEDRYKEMLKKLPVPKKKK